MSTTDDGFRGDVYPEDIHEETAHQSCYLYLPRTADGGQRPSKRRKTAHIATDSEAHAEIFPALLSGQENVQHAKRRRITFQKCWAEQKSRVAHLLEPADNAFLGEVVQFVKEAPTLPDRGRLRTGLILCGPKAGSQTSLLERWNSTYSQSSSAIVVSLNPTQAANLITALKNLIRAAITQVDGLDGYQTFLNERKRRIPMNYDLELLQEFVASRSVQRCVLYLTDIEAFDMLLLTDLISVVSAWKDRIPFVLLLGLSTTVDLFEARLSRSTIRLLDCRLFDASVRADPCAEIYQSLNAMSNVSGISLGPDVSSILFEMSREQDAGVASFDRAIKHTIMSHFFANALSILLEPDTEDLNAHPELCEAIRCTDSFRAHAEEILDKGDLKTVRGLLNDDRLLLGAAREAVRNGRETMSRHHAALELFEAVSKVVKPSETPQDSFFIQVQALSGSSFLDSPLYTDLISKITILPSNDMRKMLDAIQQQHSSPGLDATILLERLDHVIPPDSTKGPLRTAYDPRHTTTSTTVTNNKVSLSKHGPKLSAKETEYTRLVDQITNTLTSYFETHIVNPVTLFMHEAFVYNLKSPLATVFTPRPRYAAERALSMPYDYLGCECCEGDASTRGGGRGQILATQPPTSILWQLWCEAGGIVNVRDLWEAFRAIVIDRKEREDGGKEEEEEREEEIQGNNGEKDVAEETGVVDERMALALFYRGLAELRMMGFVKPTKRKADCLAKTAWRGL
ncbi:hypothetical protein EPUS_03921 [Endocarpon pusillum Z07020]|uniref:Uncharacterized protein n=1 Tax=Endocarpon pusillum (strain Z07020 / HMAS-L-300199) TaxID=1263415 RepID=U1GQ70_ENDPU|nr:uncharacterized protein EPUS_03921 [Endocarpon pusillum Z07020]ERF74483.1 hypothetical protein EPUS_03921 [Endocarpon pusillum Z07020]